MRDLLEIVGAKLFEEIVDLFGGTAIYIVSRTALERFNVYEKIRREYKSGVSKADLAVKYHYSPRQIHKIVSGRLIDRKGPRQKA